MKKHALIVAGGAPPGFDLLKREIERADFVIAADSGADVLLDMTIRDLTLVGDFDSIAPDVLKAYQEKQTKMMACDAHKDETDTMLAMDAGILRGAKTITVLGALGKRLDHQLANIGLLLYAKKHGADAELLDETTRVFLVKKETRFSVPVGVNLSIFAVSKQCVFSSSSGLAYPLDGLILYREKPIGVSNAAVEERIIISKKSGTAMVVVSG